jgi:hypothetical protein
LRHAFSFQGMTGPCLLLMVLLPTCVPFQQKNEENRRRTLTESPGLDGKAPPGDMQGNPNDTNLPAAQTPARARTLFGIGVSWGSWNKLEGERAKAFDKASLDKIKEAHGNATKVNLAWWDIENRENVWTWDYVDHQVQEAKSRQLEIFAYIGLTPDWALPPGILSRHGSGAGYRFPPDPAYQSQFIRYLQEVAKRYRGKIRNYLFWNEPNGCSWKNDDCRNSDQAEEYTKWLRLAYETIKAVDPQAWVAIGGLDANHTIAHPEAYLEDIYRFGGGEFFDAVSIHPYGEPLNWAAVDRFRQVMLQHQQGQKPLWLGEYGWKEKTESEKAQMIKEVLGKLHQGAYEFVTMANYLVISDLPLTPDQNRDFGLCDRNMQTLSLTPRESWQAFQESALKLSP